MTILLITVCKYDVYQDVKVSDNQRLTNSQPSTNQKTTSELTNKQPTINHQLTTTKERTENKELKEVKKLKKNKNDFFVKGDISEKLKVKIQEYIEYRNEIGKPYRSQKSINELLKQLQQGTEKDAIMKIEQSIRRGWLDIYPLENKLNNKTNPDFFEPSKVSEDDPKRLEL